ncbi:MAG: ABC transporter ATP-binding protein, partial [Firmicutes bacterium]|nr:ABC transporter ATP-binding protein [Bacillota bacterium]
MPLIELESVVKTYRTGKVAVEALRGVTLAIESGEFVSIMGPSGSGKSTLLNIIGCLDRPTDGRFKLNGESVDGLGDIRLAELRNRNFGFVFQSFHLMPRLTALKNVELPLVYRGVPARKRRDAAMDMLEAVGIREQAERMPGEMSGGQQQRVALARALVGSPLVILADEPTGNLDTGAGKEIMRLLQNLNVARGITIV